MQRLLSKWLVCIFSSFSSSKHGLTRRTKGSAVREQNVCLVHYCLFLGHGGRRVLSQVLSLAWVRESLCERGAECGRPLSLSRSPAFSWAGTTGPQASNQATSDLSPAWERVLSFYCV